MEWTQGEFRISDSRDDLDLGVIHGYLTRSYWAEGIPRETVARSLQHSLNFGLITRGEQIGFARVVSDYTTFAYLADVFVLEEWRGKGLSKWLMSCVTAHPELQGLRRFCLGTLDAHGLYRQFGFEVIQRPENWMEIKKENHYRR